jgi:hypothetical protein
VVHIFFIKSYNFLVRIEGLMHCLFSSRVNNRHSGVSVACQTTNIVFLWNAQYAIVCCNVKMAQETLDPPLWGGVFVLGLRVRDNMTGSKDNHISPSHMVWIWGSPNCPDD